MGSFLLAATEEWDGDEGFLLFLCGVVSIGGLIHGWSAFLAAPALRRDRQKAAPLLVTVALAVAFLLYVTWNWSSKESRDGESYTWLVMVMGTAWLTTVNQLASWLGVSLRDDACERANSAAVLALCGALTGATLLYAGATSGEGPSFWNNVFTLGAGGFLWFLLWLALEWRTQVSRAVTEDRDPASGLRLAGFLAAQGLILGRAMAGNWHSAAATVADLVREGWPSVLVLAVAVVMEGMLGPSPKNPAPKVAASGALALLLCLGAAAWVVKLGWWEGAPR